MASRIACADGLFTAAATWGVVDTTSILNTGLSSGSSSVVATAASWGVSAQFAPGAIEIDGFAVAIYARAVSPSGTLTVRLYNVTDSAVVGSAITINVSDIIEATNAPTNYQQQRWYFFYLGAQTLIAGKNYRIEAQTSAATQVSLYTNGTASNWLRMLRTTTTGAPANPDLLFVMGEWTAAATKTDRTVTMDNTATTIFGGAVVNQDALFIGNGGTVSVGGPAAGNPPAAATAYFLKLGGDLYIAAGGSFNGGTVGNEVPRDSSFTLRFDSASAKLYNLRNRGSFVLQGLSRTTGKNVVQCKLNGDEAVGQTILSVDADTGWLNTDEVCIAGTIKGAGNDEVRTLSASDATTITVTAGLTYAHKGSQGQEAEVILLTRNVVMDSTSGSYHSGVFSNGPNATWDCDWVMFKYIGANSRLGISHKNTAQVDTYDFCSWYDCYASPNCEGTAPTGGYGVTLTDCVLKFSTSYVASGGLFYNQPSSPNAAYAMTWRRVVALCFNQNTAGATHYTNYTSVWDTVTIAGLNQNACTLLNSTSPLDEYSKVTFTDVTLHSCGNSPMMTISGVTHQTITRLNAWAAGTNWVALTFQTTCRHLTFDSCTFWGNSVAAVEIGVSAAPICREIVWKDCIFAGQTNLSQPDGIIVANGNYAVVAMMRFENCSFGVATGNYVAHTDADILMSQGTAYYSAVCDFTLLDCNLASGTAVKNLDYLVAGNGVIRQSKIAGVANTHQTSISKMGTLAYDAANFRTAAPGETLTPACVAGSSTKFRSTIKRAGIASGNTLVATVYFKKTIAYVGTDPKLIVLANPALGWDDDVTLAQDAGSSAAWTALSGSTAVAGEDGIAEFCVEIDGLAGSVYVDDWSAV